MKKQKCQLFLHMQMSSVLNQALTHLSDQYASLLIGHSILAQKAHSANLSIQSICQNGTMILVAQRRVLLVGKMEELQEGFP